MPEHGERLNGERKFAVALFADLSGYTALCRRLDLEEVDATVGPTMTELRTAAEHAGGVIAHVAGDGFFAIFGVPVAQADAPERAVRAALEMRDVIARRNAVGPVIRIPDVHIGIAAGEILVTPSDDHPGWAVLGSTINLASRLCDAASGGSVLVDASMRRLLGPDAPASHPVVLEVRGHDKAVEAWALELQDPVPAGRTINAAPFVGRSDALANLTSRWHETLGAGRSAVARVAGHAGIGKSRLVAEWLSSLRPAPRAAWVRCSATVATSMLLEVSAAIESTATGTAAGLPLNLGPTAATSFRADPTPAAMAGVLGQLGRAGAEGAFVLVIDDFHDADAELRELIDRLAAREIAQPVLAVCALRDEDGGSASSDIRIGGLNEAEVREVLTAALGGELPAPLAEQLVDRIHGLPLLAMQMSAYLVEAQILHVVEGQCEVADRAALDQLPDSVRLFISARLDRLPPAEKYALQCVSSMGDRWTTSWAEHLLGTSAGSLLRLLSVRSLTTEVEQDEWRVAHSVVQEVAYSSLTRRDRADLHRRQLELLPADASPGRRAFHALRWASSASRHDRAEHLAATVAACEEALAYAADLSRAGAQSAHQVLLEVRRMTEDLADVTPDLAARVATLDAQCLVETGGFDEALRAATFAVARARDARTTPTIARALIAHGHALSRLRRFESARQSFDEAITIADKTEDGNAKALALRLMAETWRHSLFTRYIALLGEAFEAFRECGDSDGAADCARELAYLHSIGAPSLHDYWYKLAVETTRADDARGRGSLARTRGFALITRFDFAGAEREARAAITWAEESGTADVLSDALACHVLSLIACGRPEEAATVVMRLGRFADGQGNARMSLVSAAVSAHIYLRRGDTRRALEELDVARDRLARFGPSEERTVTQVEGLVAMDRGDWESALRHFTRSAELASEAGFRLDAMADQVVVMRAQAQIGAAVSMPALERLRADCLESEVPLLASYADAVGELARVNAREVSQGSTPAEQACLEELAVRADTAGVRLEVAGQDPSNAWRAARELWEKLGYTIWLARAQARSGDIEAAKHTLDVLDSPAEARAWALGEADAS